MMSIRNCCVTLRLLLLVGGCLGQQQNPELPTNLEDPRIIPYLLERPAETLIAPKGENGEVILVTPRNHWPDRYQNLSSDLQNRIGAASTAKQIIVPDMELPDLSLPLQLSRDEPFSTFIPLHRAMASSLINVFMALPYREFINAAALVRDDMNPGLWTYAMQVALIHRNDTQNIETPPLSAIMPEKFVGSAAFRQAREEASILPPEDRVPIIIPLDYTASDLDMEHRLAYFREDMGLNLHHWQWHLVYPFEGGTNSIVNKDRRGELFSMQHQQIIARYDFERLCNKLNRVVPLTNYREPIKEAYFPKLDSLVASRTWPARMEDSRLKDINRPGEQLVFDINDLEMWRDRILQAIHEGRALSSNYTYVNLVNFQGIDILGNMMEATSLNINTNLYGNLHNLGHVAISLVHDPDQRYQETFGVMGDLATAMRDPAFYRWHKMVDNIFQQHKATLLPYTVQELGFNNIVLRAVEIRSQGYPVNELNTFWQQSDVDLSRGLDIYTQGTVYARLTHLQHAPFTYRIQVENTGQRRNGTVRIFMAPRFDERGLPMPLRVHRHLFIEMDKFTADLRSGNNTFERRSTQSSLTIPYERTFRPLDQTRVTPIDQEYNFCGCGWPQHMLVPKGSPEGFPVEIFVMVSNYADDRVDQPPPTGCQAAHSFCGFFNRKYPDRRPMGFPFDRNPRPGAETMELFRTPNMRTIFGTIRFTNTIRLRNGTTVS